MTMIRSSRRAAFTLIEMITVIAIIVILVSLVLAINGLVQNKAARTRAQNEIQALSSACESYRTDNGGYPQDQTPKSSVTSALNAVTMFNPTGTGTPTYAASSLFLYKQLTGDVNATGAMDSSKNYAPDFWKPTHLSGIRDANNKWTSIAYIMDPYGNSYGYSTAGLLLQQENQALQATSPGTAPATANTCGSTGYNVSFDLWSTGGTVGNGGTNDQAKWLKNW
jgi:prepilin-type N-terminal cleavage/methylation domain-containing protein